MLVYQNSNYVTIELENYEDFTREFNNAISYGPSIHVSVFHNHNRIDLETVKTMTVEQLNTLILVNDLDIIECLVCINRYRNNELSLYFLPSKNIAEYKFLPGETKFRLESIKPEITSTNELIHKSLSYDILKGQLNIY